MDYDYNFDYAEALKRVGFTQAQVDALRESARKCATVPKSLTNRQLLMFLKANDGDIDKANRMIERHYEIRRKAPQLFVNRDSRRPELQKTMANEYFTNLPPIPGPKRYLVVYNALSTKVAKNTVYDYTTTCFLMMLHTSMYKNGPADGIILLYDIKNLTTAHLLRSNLKSMRRFFEFIQEGIPIKVHAVHIFNTVSFFSMVMTMIKPFLNREIAERLHLHPSSLDMEKFYADYVPRSCLPSDHGGVCAPVEVLHEKLLEEFLEMREHFKAEEKQAALESDP